MLKRAQKSFDSIAFIKLTSNTQLLQDIFCDAIFAAEMGFMVGRCVWE